MLSPFPKYFKMIILLPSPTPEWTVRIREGKIGNIYANENVGKVATG